MQGPNQTGETAIGLCLSDWKQCRKPRIQGSTSMMEVSMSSQELEKSSLNYIHLLYMKGTTYNDLLTRFKSNILLFWETRI